MSTTFYMHSQCKLIVIFPEQKKAHNATKHFQKFKKQHDNVNRTEFLTA